MNEHLEDLESIFADLYPGRQDGERLADYAGLDRKLVDFSGSAQNMWHNILRQAEIKDSIGVLVAKGQKEFPGQAGKLAQCLDGEPPPTDFLRSWKASGLVVLLFLAATVALFAANASTRAWELARDCGNGAQFLVLVAVFIHAWFVDRAPRLRSADGEQKECEKSVKQFAEYWKKMWILWVIFYGVHSLRDFLEYRNPDLANDRLWSGAMSVVTTLNHNLQSAAVLILFWMMIRPTLKDPDDLENHYTPALIACSLFALTHALSLNVFKAELWAELASGITAAVCLGMFVGRLESKFLDVHVLEFVVLYAYAGVQPLYRLLRASDIVAWNPDLPYLPLFLELFLRAFALAAKLGLYFIVRRQITSGRLTFYMWKVRALHDETPKEWEAFKRGQVSSIPGEPEGKARPMRG